MSGQRGLAAAFAGLALLAAATTSAAANLAAEGSCSLNTIRGTYAWEMKGQTFGGGLSSDPLPVPGGIPMLQGTVFPVYMTGVMTIESDGNATGTYSGLFGLVPLGYSSPVPWTATFTVLSDCTGLMHAPNAFGGTNTDVIAILDYGREVRTIGVDGAPFVWQFRMMRIARADEGAPTCGPDTARGRYSKAAMAPSKTAASEAASAGLRQHHLHNLPAVPRGRARIGRPSRKRPSSSATAWADA